MLVLKKLQILIPTKIRRNFGSKSSAKFFFGYFQAGFVSGGVGVGGGRLAKN